MVFAGGIVVVAILGLVVARIPFITAGGIGISIIVLVMVLASITLLPALLGLAGHRVNGRWARRTGPSNGRWHRWAGHVGRHATAYAVGSTLSLLALAAPVSALTLGFPDEGTMPQSRTERRAYDLIAAGFGPGANGALVIAVDLADDPGGLQPLTAAVAADPGIAEVSPARVDDASGIAVIVAEPTTTPQSEATRETIDRLRAEVFPEALDGSSARAHIGGQVAVFADLGHRVQERLPWFIAAVVLLSFLLLLVVFRSLLVPLKAAVMNLLSVGAAYGVLVMVFQWGWGADLIGLESTVPILSFIPLFMFAILFGLSMDYEVFLLSRVREEYDRTGDNDDAVRRGLAGTARTITCAALIMVAVFGGFVLAEDPLIKMMGLGLASAIAIDATIVRLVLVPATMKLLGQRELVAAGLAGPAPARAQPVAAGGHARPPTAGRAVSAINPRGAVRRAPAPARRPRRPRPRAVALPRPRSRRAGGSGRASAAATRPPRPNSTRTAGASVTTRMPARSTATDSPTPNCLIVGSLLRMKLAKTDAMISAAAVVIRALDASAACTASRASSPAWWCCWTWLTRNTS